MRNYVIIIAAMALMVTGGALAETITIECFGSVEFSQVNQGELADVVAGDLVYATMTVDSENWLPSPSGYGVRSYPINMASFEVSIGSVGPIALVNPQPYDRTPYFNLRESDPVADGFFIACNQENDMWFPSINIPGGMDPWFGFHWAVSYSGDTLSSLDITDAIGTYDYTGLQSFYTSISDSWADAIGLEYGRIVISSGTVATEAATLSSIKAMYR